MFAMKGMRSIAAPASLPHACRLFCVAAALSISSAPTASAQQPHIAPVTNFFNAHIRAWLNDPLIVGTLKADNQANQHLSRAEIEALDAQWVSEINGTAHPLVDKLLATPLSRFLRQKEDEASGSITEIIVMDAKGLNAGQSGVTSDYWQGDEDKFRRTFETGPKAMFVDEARKDESTQMLQSQVSMTIVDEQGRPIGAITVGVNLDQL
jgi:hypothetical protein